MYQAPWSERPSRTRKKSAVPTSGPSSVPRPPITAMKIGYAVQLMLKAASGEMRSRLR